MVFERLPSNRDRFLSSSMMLFIFWCFFSRSFDFMRCLMLLLLGLDRNCRLLIRVLPICSLSFSSSEYSYYSISLYPESRWGSGTFVDVDVEVFALVDDVLLDAVVGVSLDGWQSDILVNDIILAHYFEVFFGAFWPTPNPHGNKSYTVGISDSWI